MGGRRARGTGPRGPRRRSRSATVRPVPGHLDAAAGAPLHPVARTALLAALDDGWADPARLYQAGRRARLLLDAARESLADSLGARPDEISFAANATQALHAAVLGSAAGNRRAGRALVHSAVEHSAVLHAVGRLDTGVSVGVDRYARVDADAFVAAGSRPGVAAAALQAANHEVGTTQPVRDVADRIAPVPLVVDATQTVGHAPVPEGWSVLAADARTWGGPTAGVLAVRTGTRWRSPFPEDEREGGRMPGMPAVPAVVAAAASLRAVLAERHETAARHRALIDRIRRTVAAAVPDVEVLGDPVDRLPHIVTFSCLYADGEALLAGLDRRGFAVSSGSSCTSSTLEPSHVLVAMGALTSGNVRVSLHAATTGEEVDGFLAALPAVVAAVRAELGAAGL
jgi:cysteine desulfurase